jgi:phytoene synthase
MSSDFEAGVTDREAVRQSARHNDQDRYLAALLAPRDVRDDLLALAAFAGEIARVPYAVKEPMMGEVRLQWWRDALPLLAAGTTTGNPVADALGGAIRRHALPERLLADLLEARAFDLYADPMPDMTAFRGYLAKTDGALIEMALRIVGGWPPGTAAGVAMAAGRAVGVTRVLSDLPFMLSRGRCALPADRLSSAGIEAADLAADPIGTPALSAIAGFVADARADLAAVRAGWRRIPRRERSALLPVALIEPQLRVFEKPSHHPGRDLAAVVPLSRIWALWSAHVLGRI